MGILNYTTKVPVIHTTSQIQVILVKAGAQAIMTEFDGDGEMCAISFRANTADGMLSFRLPARIDGVYRVLSNDTSIGTKLRSKDQARRVTWRILKDWIEAQMALIEAEMAELAEVFLPYAQNHVGITMYEAVKKQGFAMLTDQTDKDPGDGS